MKKLILLILAIIPAVASAGTLHSAASPASIKVFNGEWEGVLMAAENLALDFERVTGARPLFSDNGTIVIGTLGHSGVDAFLTDGQKASLSGKREMYLIVSNSDGIVIAGSDKRGTIYGIYTLSEMIGVSPWYWWADVPVRHKDEVTIENGEFTDGEPAVTYRGLFLNDEAPCLTTWVKNTYGTDFGGHEFYGQLFELLLRLKANFLWPAMWNWSFYADDPLNSELADKMGIIMGTSHHEPMARNHQEWVRNRDKYGVWDFDSNRKVIEKFFTEGMERAKNTEDLITIGMRGDGDTALGGKEGHDDEYVARDKENMKLLERIFKSQRNIIRKVTGKPAEQRPQVWALYKEVQKFYDLGLRVPDDVTILLSDDNWGDVRKLPTAGERNRKGGWGIYYHVDYVGAPRNSKWLNVTPVQNLWEQMQLTYAYGVDRLWVLNVGDLKPMEYPVTLFLDMAWNPTEYSAGTLHQHTRKFCASIFGEEQADEAARILDLGCKYNGRTTAEMMDCTTYDLESGEFRRVCDDYARLEAEALRQYISLDESQKDAYFQIILFPVQAMGNICEMYYAQAMNLKLFEAGLPEANLWADRVEECFNRDVALMKTYNKDIAGGKWDGMMIQKHIGYFMWNDNFPADRLPRVKRIGKSAPGGYIFPSDKRNYISIEAEHFFSASDAASAAWTVIPNMGRTLSGVALMPYTEPTDGAALTYRIQLPEGTTQADVHVIVKSTLAFNNVGHRWQAGFEGCDAQTVCFNEHLNEDPRYIYTVYYPTVARRVKEDVVTLSVKPDADGWATLTIKPLDAGIVFEKIVIDCGGYTPQFLFGSESDCKIQ